MLCRVFKKSAPSPKIIDHVAVAPCEEQLQFKTFDRSSVVNIFPMEQADADLESSNYLIQPYNNSSPSMARSSSSHASASWMEHFLAEESFFSSANAPFPSQSTFSSMLSKVILFILSKFYLF